MFFLLEYTCFRWHFYQFSLEKEKKRRVVYVDLKGRINKNEIKVGNPYEDVKSVAKPFEFTVTDACQTKKKRREIERTIVFSDNERWLQWHKSVK